MYRMLILFLAIILLGSCAHSPSKSTPQIIPTAITDTAAQVHIANGEFAEAIDLLEEAADDRDEDDFQAHQLSFQLGELYLRQGDRRQALEHWQDYLEPISEATAADGYAVMAEIDRRYIYVGQSARFYDGATLTAAIWRAAVGLDPGELLEGSDFPAHPSPATVAHRLGWLELMHGNGDAAFEAYRRFAADDARGLTDEYNPAEPILEITQLFEWAERPDLVIEYIESTGDLVEISGTAAYRDELQPEQELTQMHARYLLEAGEETEALNVLRTFVHDSPPDPTSPPRPYEPVLKMAKFAVELERPEWGRTLFEEFRDNPEHQPPNLLAVNRYGETLSHLYDDDKIRELTHELMANSDITRQYEIYGHGARIFLDAGLIDDAVDFVLRSYEEGPNPPSGFYRLLAEVMWKADDIERLVDLAEENRGLDAALRDNLQRLTDAEFAARFLINSPSSDADDLRSAALLFRLASQPQRSLEATNAAIEAAEYRALALEKSREDLRAIDATDRLIEVLEELRQYRPDDATVHLELSQLYLARDEYDESLAVLDDYVDQFDHADEGKQRLIDAIGQWREDRDPRALLNFLHRELNNDDEESTSNLVFIADTYARYTEIFQLYGTNRTRGAQAEFDLTGRDITAAWYRRFLDATADQNQVDDTGRTWSELAQPLWERQYFDLAETAWARAERYDEWPQTAPLLSLWARLKTGDFEGADEIMEYLLKPGADFYFGEVFRIAVGTLAEYDRIDDARRLLNFAIEEHSDRPLMLESHFRQLRMLAANEEDAQKFVDVVERYQARQERRDGDFDEALLHEAGLIDEFIKAQYGPRDDIQWVHTVPPGISIYARAGDVDRVEEMLEEMLYPLSETTDEEWLTAYQIWTAMGENDRARHALEMAVQRADIVYSVDERYPARHSAAQWLAAVGDGDAAWHHFEYRRDVYPFAINEIHGLDSWFGIFRAHHHYAQAERIAHQLLDLPHIDDRTRSGFKNWLEPPSPEQDEDDDQSREAAQLLQHLMTHELASAAEDSYESGVKAPPYHADIEAFVDDRNGDIGSADIEAFIATYQNRFAVRQVLVDRLIEAGFYDGALTAAEGGIAALPAPRTLELGIMASLYTAEPDKFIEFFDHHRAVARDESVETIGTLLADRLGDADAATIATAAEHLRQFDPSNIDLLTTHVRALEAAGDTDAARNEVTEFMDGRERTPRLIDELPREVLPLFESRQ